LRFADLPIITPSFGNHKIEAKLASKETISIQFILLSSLPGLL